MNSGNKQAELFEQAQELLVNSFGKTLVVAPHQDDESLGCGGTIALLRQADVPVEIVFVSDGSMSHPNSNAYPTERLVALRETEALKALEILGVGNESVHFMRLKDSLVPNTDSIDFESAVQQFLQLLEQTQPETILVPWRRDPHQDHRASWQIVDTALTRYGGKIRRMEYLIWLWERGEANEFPTSAEANLWQVNIAPVKNLKKQAIYAHVSQTTRLIDDDPQGFILSPEVLGHFDRDYELFAEGI